MCWACAGFGPIRLTTLASVLYRKCGSICACSARRRASASSRAVDAINSFCRASSSARSRRFSAEPRTQYITSAIATASTSDCSSTLRLASSSNGFFPLNSALPRPSPSRTLDPTRQMLNISRGRPLMRLDRPSVRELASIEPPCIMKPIRLEISSIGSR